MSSSPPHSSSASNPAAEEKSSPNRSIAFLVHSPDSVANNLPPDCDNKPLARQRRRRTSPDDQCILEEAFARNPRPSKEERAEIISRVALGDKEVQIWFQNRRQSSRRKSKPLDTQDSNLSFSGSSSAPSSPIEKPLEVETLVEQEMDKVVEIAGALDATVEDKVVQQVEKVVESETTEALVEDTKGRSSTTERPTEAETETQATVLTTSIMSSQDALASTFPTELNSSQNGPSSSQDVLFTSITKPTYLANRRSASFVRQQVDEAPLAAQPSSQEADRTPGLRKSGSYLRLSMSEDGQARVIDRSVPSPPRSQPIQTSPTTDSSSQGGLRRSYSAAGLADLFRTSSSTAQSQPAKPPKLPRVSTAGRSRDSRAWEFWCDSEARDSLKHKAEQEGSGSAADAIGLIRQNSRGALRPASNRMANSPLTKQNSFNHGHGKSKGERPKLQRASTTYGRLQDPKKGTYSEEGHSPGADSDKENWDPDENATTAPRHRPANARRGRTILGENANIPSYATSLGGLMDSEKKRRNQGPAKVDAEVAAFMGSGADGGENEDLDCVQSLLSLSKGNWR